MYKEDKDSKVHVKTFRITYMLDCELEDTLGERIAEYEKQNGCKFQSFSIVSDREASDILTFRTATILAVFC